jgi:TPR repeat protein
LTVTRTADEWCALFAGPAQPLAVALAEAAQAGDADALLQYGQCLLDGRGVAQDQRAALAAFHRAAQAGSVAAITMVGRCLDQGWGAPDMPAEAARWFERAAALGHDWGRYNLATALALGRGVPRDRARALALFRRAAMQGHAKSSGMVGLFHEQGWVVPQSDLLAAYYYARAAQGGDFRGAFNHGRMLVAQGRADCGGAWFEQARNGALAAGNARFVDQMTQWLAAEGFTSSFANANDSQEKKLARA